MSICVEVVGVREPEDVLVSMIIDGEGNMLSVVGDGTAV
jgi:hypothetical protein